MTTAEAIEKLKDPGKFEVLATRVLRITEPDCEFLEHVGVSAVGKTVPNPIDAFCKVPRTDPPRFLMAAFSTDHIKTLEHKWLYDHKSTPHAKEAKSANDGDLIKASRRSLPLRKSYPGATFIVYLCTNKQPSDQLLEKVLTKGESLGLEVRFLTRSRLRDILDMNPDGQWLRQEHLGIAADRLSLPLLRDLSKKSLLQYRNEFLITLPEVFIHTSSEKELQGAIDSLHRICIMTGASGSGKSVVCYQILHDHLNQNGTGLWIPGEIAARSISFENAVYQTLRNLRNLHPSIELNAVQMHLVCKALQNV